MTEKKTELKKITLKQFLRHFKDARNQRFCFILGAGASKSSGIPTGEELAKKWINEIKEDLGKEKFADWKSTQKINNEDDCARHYSEIFTKRFEIDHQGGYDALEIIMEEAKPSCGYSFLAAILEKGIHNVVITTNFDSLTEEALFIYTSEKPLIIGHSALANFISTQLKRPQIIKIHHDLFLSPKNTHSETQTIDDKLKEGLTEIFKYYCPVVVGYGGNDGLLMDVLRNVYMKNLYWCLLENQIPSKEIRDLITEKNGCIVPISSFDGLMVELGNELEIPLLDKRLKKIADQRMKSYRDQIDAVAKEKAKAMDNLIDRSEKNWWLYVLKAQQADTDTERENIYKEGLERNPQSAELATIYANFLMSVKKDHDHTKKYYERALEINPNYVFAHSCYAEFLILICKDFDTANKHYQKALALNPDDLHTHSSYAVFLTSFYKDFYAAEKHHKKSLELEPNNAHINGNYAWFLLQNGDLEKAKKLIDMAFSCLPKSPEKPRTKELELNLWFYRYACFFNDYLNSETQIARLLDEGERSENWNLEGIVKRAKELHHPNYEKVKQFAKRITAQQDPQ